MSREPAQGQVPNQNQATTERKSDDASVDELSSLLADLTTNPKPTSDADIAELSSILSKLSASFSEPPDSADISQSNASDLSVPHSYGNGDVSNDAASAADTDQTGALLFVCRLSDIHLPIRIQLSASYSESLDSAEILQSNTSNAEPSDFGSDLSEPHSRGNDNV